MNNIEKELRPSVLKFAKAMELILRKNDHKGGWSPQNCTIQQLEKRLHEELAEYIIIGNDGNYSSIHEKKAKELVDVANFCMMIYHRHLHTGEYQ